MGAQGFQARLASRAGVSGDWQLGSQAGGDVPSSSSPPTPLQLPSRWSLGHLKSLSCCCRRFRERIEPVRSHVPPAALKVIDEELDKLQGLEQASSEFNVTRNYLDWLTQMPWGKHTQERLEIEHAQQVGKACRLPRSAEDSCAASLCSKLVQQGVGSILCMLGKVHSGD